MSNEIVESLSSGEIAVYDPGQPLAPMNHNSLANTDVDLLHERQHAPQTLTMFGAPLPQGTTKAAADATLNEIGTLFIKDMGTLKYPANLIGFAAKWFRQHATDNSRQVRVNHNFELPSELMHDWLTNDFCNSLENIEPGTKRQKQQFLTAAITWLAKLTKQLNAQTGSEPAPRTAPNSAEAILNSLSDSDYAKVIAINDKAQAQTMNILAAKHGEYSVRQVVEIAQTHLNSLPAIERAHFDQFTSGWVHMMNCVETLEFLYNAAIGSASLPRDGAGIAQEIAQIEALMRDPAARRAYMRDPQLQARYRTLLDMKG